jgi:uncharacterized protein YjdB
LTTLFAFALGCSESKKTTLTAIALSPSAATIAKGQQQAFTATASYSDNSTKDVSATASWSSSNRAVATVDASGNAAGVAVGQTTLQATLNGVNGTASLTVTAATLKSIAVTPTNPTFAAGTTRQLVATGTFSDNTTGDISSQVTWTSSDASVATVSASGLVTGVKAGSATIAAAKSGLNGADSVTITAATVTAVAVTPTSPSLAAGLSIQLTATATLSDNSTQDVTTQATWTSSESSIAAVSSTSTSSGLVVGVAAGSATITATFGGQSGTDSVTVTAAVLESIALTPPSPSIAAGTTQQFTATGTFSDQSTQPLTGATWSSSSTTVATINGAGLASGAAAGSTTITATDPATSKTGTTSLTVTPATLVSIAVTPPASSIALGTAQQFIATGTYTDHSTQTLTDSVTWSSEHPEVATLDNASGAKGLSTSVAKGTTNVTATLSGVTSTAVVLTVTDATLVSINLTPTEPSIALGTQQQFVATGSYTDRSNQDLTASVTWSSQSATVASISNAAGSNGLAAALKEGTTIITATDPASSKTGTTNLAVTAAVLASISVTPPSPSIPAGLSQQFTATGSYTDKTTQDLTPTVSWSSSDTSVATISNAPDSRGFATAAATGTTTVTANLGVLSGTAKLTVNAQTLKSITVNPPNPQIPLKSSVQFSATATYSDGPNTSTADVTNLATWGSADPLTLGISSAPGSQGLAVGLVVGGPVTVGATLEGVSGYTDATVTPAALVSIAITPSIASIPKGSTQGFVATGTYTDNTNNDITAAVTWASSDNAIATISSAEGSNGRAKAVGVGAVDITAALGSISGGAKLEVTTATLVSIDVTPASASVAAGLAKAYAATGTYTDLSTQDLTETATWVSDNLPVASVSNAAGSRGLATTFKAGATRVSAVQGGVTSPQVTLTVTTATLVRVEVNPGTSDVPNGTTRQFTATGVYTDNSAQDLTATVAWDSSDAAVATVSNLVGEAGLATGLKVGGPVTISATSGNVKGTAALTVTAAVLKSIAVSPPAPVIPATLTQPFTATGTYTDTSTQDITKQVTWTSSADAVATISNANGTEGLANGVTPGETTISATLGAISGSATLTVSKATLDAILVSPNCSECNSIPAGRSLQFTAIGFYSDGSKFDLTSFATWGTVEPTIAAVSNASGSQGLLTGLVAGTTGVFATYQSVTGTDSSFQVTDALLLSIAVNPPEPSIPNGNTQQFSAVGTYSDHTTRDLAAQVTWSSSNEGIAKVSNASGSNGLAQSITPASGHTGTAIITAMDAASGFSATASLTVTAAVLKQIAITPPAPSFPNGTTLGFTANGTYSDSTVQDLTKSVTWSSSDVTVLDVSNIAATAGVASGLAQGSVTVMATDPDSKISGSTNATVTPAVLRTIEVQPNTASIAKGTSVHFSATGHYSDSSSKTLTAEVAWTSGNASVASVSNSAGSEGRAVGTGVGSTAITATLGLVSGAANITVTRETLVSIAVSPNPQSMAKGTTVFYHAIGTFTDGSTQDLSSQVTWQSSDEVVASISNQGGSNGLATALTKGEATISATFGAVSGTGALTVTGAVLDSLTISPLNPRMPVSSTQQFTTNGHYSDGTTQDLTSQSSWSTDNPAVVTISNSKGSWGLATALTSGSVRVTAAAGGATASTTATVPGT